MSREAYGVDSVGETDDSSGPELLEWSCWIYRLRTMAAEHPSARRTSL